MSIPQNLRNLAAKWEGVPAAERANYQLYLVELAEALEVGRPQPRGSNYEFEFPISIVNPNGTTTTKFADLYKAGHFLLEAKDEAGADSRDILLRRAFGQSRHYAAWVAGAPPPYLLTLDVGTTLMVWDNWSGSYGDYHAGRRIALSTLADRPEDIALLRDIWANPRARDPRGRAEAVTRQIAEHLAQLAASLETRGHDPELVARFLIRCVFTMFAEDVGLLPDEPFRQAVQEIGLNDPEEFSATIEGLWKAMDEGGRFGIRRYLRFNGHFFRDQRALPLTRDDFRILLEAARADWAEVEPSIMGTLLTRALDPHERHKLGAEYTPREFVERLVRPTVEEPIRERWTRVQAEVLQLRSRTGKTESTIRKQERQALESLRGFHGWMRGLRFLDPACGSGNFLYVTLNLVKEIELEVIRAIEEITQAPEIALEEVDPSQFYGIEVNAWARELAELTLWIGFHQWWRRTHGHVQPPEPVLRDTGTLEHRDAVLVWDAISEDPERSRPDPTPRVRHPVTGELVPDPEVRLSYWAYEHAGPAPWPAADFIVGNPPYMGRGRQRDAFGDGYVDSLRAAYPEVPDNADYVMYWWHRAAVEVAAGRTTRAGLITTNTITQRHNREIIERAAEHGVGIVWAAPDHPWVDDTGSAAVRVAMTVLSRDPEVAARIDVDSQARVIREVRVPQLNSDLTAHADVPRAASHPLLANKGLSSQGFTLVGGGFRLDPADGEQLLGADPLHHGIVRPIVNGRDLTTRPRGIFTIDFGLRQEEKAREYPVLYDLVRDRVKPGREANNDRSTRENWWRFGRNREQLREALAGLPRYIVTVETSKHRLFQFLPAEIAAEHSVVCIALEDGFSLGVLSSSIHVEWAVAAGGRLGIGNDPRYQKALCFDPFPFPAASPEHHAEIGQLAEKVAKHRTDAMARDEQVTMTGMYNVVEKLRAGEALTKQEQALHRAAGCGVLRDLHDELDAAVASAYGWSWPLEREEILEQLVALHDERVREEQSGFVRWLRPDYQIPRFGSAAEGEQAIDFGDQVEEETAGAVEWPSSTIEQIGALQAMLATGPVTIEDVARRFRGVRRDHVARHLDTLVIMGEAVMGDDQIYQAPKRMGIAA